MIKKLYETVVTRTQYEITRYEGTNAKGFKDDLAQVPDDAKLMEMDGDTDGGLMLLFEVEKAQAQ